MNALSSASAAAIVGSELETLRKNRFWILVLGIALVALGTAAISWACLATITIAATWLFGVVLLAGGIAEIVHAVTARGSSTLVHLLIGVLYSVVGFIVISDPGDSALVLTRIISIFLIVGGLFRIVSALSHRFAGWGWVLLNGVVTLALGVLIYREWPASGLWFIGLYLGIDMILNGWSWIALALMLGKAPQPGAAV